jgi:hypothetical protein
MNRSRLAFALVGPALVAAVAIGAPDPGPDSFVRFDHDLHADEEMACTECHLEAGDGALGSSVPGLCLDCHGVDPAHFEADDEDCATCHRPLAEAGRISPERVAAFPAPASHAGEDFLSRHGVRATAIGSDVAASCATCHTRDHCLTCHVDAPERAAVRALRLDGRPLRNPPVLRAPPSHADEAFLGTHGRDALAGEASCTTCHTRESCLVCHVATPEAAGGLPAAAPDRGAGALVERRAPAGHDAAFRDRHGAEASAGPERCAGCHAREDCLRCHRPGPASAGLAYHPTGFLARHPAAAHARETSCNDCHNPREFCASCHESSGLVARRDRLGAGYHDGQREFLLQHGQAARQSLESCVTCHTENDCLLCHGGAAVGGRGLDPHGPGFDAERLRERAPSMCTACHGAAVPGG